MEGLQTAQARIEGIAPILMKNIDAANPLNPWNLKIKEIIDLPKSQKNPERDQPLVSDYEFQAAIYYDEKLGPVFPDRVIKACIRDGGKLNSNGQKIRGALQVIDDFYPILYEGPRNIKGLLKDYQWRDMRFVGRSGKGSGSVVLCTRPRFNHWALEFDIGINPEIIKPAEIEMAISKAGIFRGIGDYRPEFGRFKLIHCKWSDV